ncbi:transposase [Bradyrhizobium sp. 138]|nr:transposase [Bradyrhizobium sp. 138]
MSRRFSRPVLRPGDIVILDNLGSHRSKAVRHLIRSVGAGLFFVPKYSPDLNPIEQVVAKLKQRSGRTVDAVCAAIGRALDTFTPEECANYLKIQAVEPDATLAESTCASFFKDLFSAVWAMLRKRPKEEIDDGVTYCGHGRLRRRPL